SSFRSSAVSSGSTRTSISFLRKACSYRSNPSPRSQPPISIVSFRCQSSAHGTREKQRVGAYEVPEVSVERMSQRGITIDDDRYPMSPQLAPLKAILAKLNPVQPPSGSSPPLQA